MVFRTEAIELYVAPARNYTALPNPKARNWLLMHLTMVAGDPVAPRDGDAAPPSRGRSQVAMGRRAE